MPLLKLSEVDWRFAKKCLRYPVLKALENCPWKTVKENKRRAVYSVGAYFVKVYKFHGPIERWKQFLDNGARREWRISKHLFNTCGHTPEPVAFGWAPGISVFITRSVEPCLTAGEFTAQKWGLLQPKERYKVVDRFADFIVHLYRSDLLQRDFNLGNILVADDFSRFFAVDLQQARILRQSLTEREIACNLSYLLPPFQHIEDRYKRRFFSNLVNKYPETRPLHRKIHIWAFKKMRRHWLRKTPRVLKTISHNNNFVVTRSIKGYLETEIDADIRKILLQNPDDLFCYATQHHKKSKRSRVSAIVLNGKKYILKRYNLKSWFHRCRRICGPSRAWKVWKNAHLFSARGIPTPKLLASIDLGKGISYQGSFALYEYIEGASKSYETLKDYYLTQPTRQKILEKLAALLCEMHQKGIYHGDAKISNFIWVETDGKTKVSVIDLDSLRLVRNVTNWQRLSDLKNMASSLAWWEHGGNIPEDLLDAYIARYPAWEKRRSFWLSRFKKKAMRQLKHREKRQGRQRKGQN